MSNIKEYYPLHVAKKTAECTKDIVFTPEEMRHLSKGVYSAEIKNHDIQACAERVRKSGQMLSFRTYEDMSDENVQLCDFISTIHAWAENKQVYKFDSDFLQELIRTEDLHITRDVFEFLPCSLMYFDFEDCQYIQDTYDTPGAFVEVIKDEKQDSWEIHLFTMKGDTKYTRKVLPLKNEDGDFSWDCAELKWYMAFSLLDGNSERLDEKKRDVQYVLLILHMLIYLSSIEPDVRESEVTKRTYRPRTKGTPVKNKFSEIQKHEVGVRFGTAFRKYSLHRVSEQGDAPYNLSKGKGSPKRPHYRKPHWSHYWYNKLDQNNEPVYNVYGVVEKVKRPKWIAAVNVNEKYGESDVVIHTVKN